MRDEIRVVLADDHTLVREGIRQFFEETDDIRVVGEASNGAEALRLIEETHPNVAVLDIRMPELTGIEATRRIKRHFPDVHVLILTAHDDDPYIRALLRAGADGYVLKTSTSEELVKALRDVHQGLTALSPAVATAVVRQMTREPAQGAADQVEALTEREIDVLRLAAQGMTNREIGRELGISHRTVQGHLANVYEKLNVSSRTEAVTDALKRGWIVIE